MLTSTFFVIVTAASLGFIVYRTHQAKTYIRVECRYPGNSEGFACSGTYRYFAKGTDADKLAIHGWEIVNQTSRIILARKS